MIREKVEAGDIIVLEDGRMIHVAFTYDTSYFLFMATNGGENASPIYIKGVNSVMNMGGILLQDAFNHWELEKKVIANLMENIFD